MAAGEKSGWTRHLITFALVFGLGAVMFYRGGCQSGPPAVRPPDARLVDVTIGRWVVHCEVADTPELRRRGFQFRPAIEPGYGMLFIFEETHVPSFWMKDTVIPLSIAFIKDDGTVACVADMAPQDLTAISPSEPVRYALEVRQGWFQDRGITAGTKVELPAEIPPAPRIGVDGAQEPAAPAHADTAVPAPEPPAAPADAPAAQ